MERVYLVRWIAGVDTGVLGIFTNIDKAKNAIDADKELYPYPDYDIEYDLESFELDEVQA